MDFSYRNTKFTAFQDHFNNITTMHLDVKGEPDPEVLLVSEHKNIQDAVFEFKLQMRIQEIAFEKENGFKPGL